MQTYFPPSINFAKTINPINGGLYATFTFSLVFALDKRIQMPDDFPFLLTDENPYSTVLEPNAAWSAILASVDKESFLDYGMPKLYSEWLMAGSAFGRGQKAVSVAVQAGALSREFLVVGDSHDAGIGMIDPSPFEKMPLVWAKTYGGKNHPENPSGKGMDKDAFGILQLPNVYENNNLTQSNQKIPACPQGKNVLAKGFHSQAGFKVFPQNMGTYDATWLKNLFPAPPKDFDWKYYNLAQPEQMMREPAAQGAVFKGLDSIRITHMHEACSEIIGQIPPYNVRFFIEYTQNPRINIEQQIPHIAESLPKVTGQWREINTQADTLWLLPNANMGVLMWHASAPTASEANIDMLSLAAYLECTLQPKKEAVECISIALAQDEASEVKSDEPPVPELPEEPEEDALKLALKVPSVAVATAATVVASEAVASPALAEEEENAIAEQEMQALVDETLTTGLDAVNAELAKSGLPPINAQDVEAKMAEFSAQLDALNAKVPEDPSPEDLLMQAGLPKDQAEIIAQALQVEPPFEADFESKAAYNKAFEAYLTEFALATGAPLESVSSSMEKVNALEKLQNDTALFAEASELDIAQNMLTDAGIAESDAKGIVEALQTPLPEDSSQESLMAYFEEFDKVIQLSDGGTAAAANEKINQLRGVQYGASSSAIADEISALDIVIPDDQKRALDLFQSELKDVSFTNKLPPDTDLSALAISCGVTSPAILAAIYEVDPMPLKAPAHALASAQAVTLPEVEVPEAEGGVPEAPEAPEAPTAEVPEEVAETAYPTPTNAEEFKEALIQEIDLSEHNMAGIDLSNLDISMLAPASLALCANLSLEGANLENAKVMKANFSKTQLAGANLTGADFTACDMTGANLCKCAMTNTIFDTAICDSVLFDGSTINQTSFKTCSAKGSSWGKASLVNSSFEGAHLAETSWIESTISQQDMSNACFSQASFEVCNLDTCLFHGDLTRVIFSDCTLKGVNFDLAQLEKARFFTSKLIDCSFNQANLCKSNWSLVSAEKMRMEKAQLDNADFDKCAFTYLQAPYASAKNANFQSCDLTGMNASFMDLFKGSLRDCVVAGADFTNASLYAADLYLMRPSENTKFDNVDLTNTILTRSI